MLVTRLGWILDDWILCLLNLAILKMVTYQKSNLKNGRSAPDAIITHTSMSWDMINLFSPLFTGYDQ